MSAIYTANVVRERDRTARALAQVEPERQRANAERDRATSALEQVSVEKNRVTEALAQVEPERLRANAERDRATTALGQVNIEKNRVTEALAQVEPERQRANAERDRATAALAQVEPERKRANAERDRAQESLKRLRGTAPIFLALAETLVENQKVDEALEKIDTALAVDPENFAAHLRRADLLQACLRIGEATESYRQALVINPGDERATASMRFCESISEMDSGSSKYPVDTVRRIQDFVAGQSRPADALIVGLRMGDEKQTVLQLAIARTKAWQSLKGWTMPGKVSGRISQESDGTLFVHLVELPIADLSPLAGLPVSTLHLDSTQVTDLKPLVGMPLKKVSVQRTPVSDLSPLKGLPLKILSISQSKVTDLSALAGMPLEQFTAMTVPIRDLSPLAGSNLKSLILSATEVSDLSPLRGLAIKDLFVFNCPIADLAPLRGAPLETVDIKMTDVTDLEPIDNPKLTVLKIGSRGDNRPGVKSLDALKLSPLTYFEANNANSLMDITALGGKPLRKVMFYQCQRLQNISPLADCPALAELVLSASVIPTAPPPPWARSVTKLKSLKSLRTVEITGRPVRTRDQFWADFSAGKL